MKKTFNIEVKKEDVGYEAYDFYHEELDDLLIPVEHLEMLPDPMLIVTLSYVDDKGYEWIAGFVLEEGTNKKFGLEMVNKLHTSCMSIKPHLHARFTTILLVISRHLWDVYPF